MKSITVDTNAFLRFLLDDIKDQVDTVNKLFADAKKGKYKLLVPQIVIFEILYGLEKFYGVPKPEVIAKLTMLVEIPYLQIQDGNLFREALELYQTHNLDLADCFIFAYSESKDAELFTFDKALKKIK